MADTPATNDIDLRTRNIVQLGDVNRRIQSVVFENRKYWIKRYSVERTAIGRFGHKLLSFIVREPIFKPSPLYTPQQALDAEVAKLQSFSNAGFSTVELVGTDGQAFVTKDAGLDLENTIRQDAEGNLSKDEILCQWAALFGRIHTAGLCHGRPHIRDSIYVNGDWVLLDFEEHPETVMPLETAQARDLILVFMQLVKTINNTSKLDQAMDRYKEQAPAIVVSEARKIIKDAKPFISLLAFLVRVAPHKDTKRLLLATRFLQQNLESH